MNRLIPKYKSLKFWSIKKENASKKVTIIVENIPQTKTNRIKLFLYAFTTF